MTVEPEAIALLHKALSERRDDDWERLYQVLSPRVRAWVQAHPSFPLAAEDAAYFTQRTLERLWNAVDPEKAARFELLVLVTSFHGTPGNLPVWLRRERTAVASTRTDAAGNAVFSRLPAGTYDLAVQHGTLRLWRLFRTGLTRALQRSEAFLQRASGAGPVRGQTLRAQGNTLRVAGRPEESLELLDQALAHFDLAGDRAEWASTETARIATLCQLGRHGEALAAGQAGLPVMLALGRYGEGLVTLGRSRALSAEHSTPRDVLVCDLFLAACYLELGRLEETAARAEAAVRNVDPDAATVPFMRAFYSHLLAGETKAGALRAAQLAMLRSRWSHPFVWAAFHLVGASGPL